MDFTTWTIGCSSDLNGTPSRPALLEPVCFFEVWFGPADVVDVVDVPAPGAPPAGAAATRVPPPGVLAPVVRAGAVMPPPTVVPAVVGRPAPPPALLRVTFRIAEGPELNVFWSVGFSEFGGWVPLDGPLGGAATGAGGKVNGPVDVSAVGASGAAGTGPAVTGKFADVLCESVSGTDAGTAPLLSGGLLQRP
ncbi:MAG: hypothetical protein JO262_01220 [Solirubrobacterales bacterium]|nr:hypothetical protein [Solirubrobacterales bacterium]